LKYSNPIIDQILRGKKSKMTRLAACLVLLILTSAYLGNYAYAEDAYTRTIRFETSFGTREVEVSYSIPHSEFQYYYDAFHPPARSNGELHFSYYVIPDSLGNLPDTLRSMATGDEEDVADTVLSFVRNVGYVNTSYTGANVLYPIETLVMGGVCDDLSVLYVTIMWSLGFNLIFLSYPHHLCVGVHLPSPPSHSHSGKYVYFDINGTKYYIAEPAGKGYMVGDYGDWPEPARIEKVVVYSGVHKYPTSIGLSSNLTGFGQFNLTAELGHSVVISGVIACTYKTVDSPVPVGLTFVFPGQVDLTTTVETGSSWRITLTHAPEEIESDLPTNQFSVLFVPDKPGRWLVYASWGGDDQMEGATSNRISFVITPPTPTPTPMPTPTPTPEWEEEILFVAAILALLIFVYLAHLSSRRPKPMTVSPPSYQPSFVPKLGCLNCGAKVSLQDRFCGSCGSPIRMCPACHTANLSNSSYCHSCGRRLTP